MLPFKIPESIGKLKDLHPDAEIIMGAVAKSGKAELHAIARLWLSEGIPFAFRDNPGLYEIIRDWIANRLCIHPKELTLIGSGRQGCSLAPPPKMGKKFDEKSDLDWSAVSPRLFDRCQQEFDSWANDYRRGIVVPRHQNEGRYWEDNANTCPMNIRRGFIDPFKIPTWSRYPLSQLFADTMWRVTKKSEATDEAPKFKKSTIRVYRNWSAFVRQLVQIRS